MVHQRIGCGMSWPATVVGASIADANTPGLVKPGDGLAAGGGGLLNVKPGTGLKFDGSKNVVVDEPNIDVLNLQNANLLATGVPKGGFDNTATLATFSNGVLGNWWVYGGTNAFSLGGQTFNPGDQLWVKTAFSGAPADLTTNFVKIANTVGQATTTAFGTVKLGSATPQAVGHVAVVGTSQAAAREDHVHPTLAAVYGRSVLSGKVILSQGADSFQDTGLSVTLPEAGTYRIEYTIRGETDGSGMTWLTGRLFNVTAGAETHPNDRLGPIALRQATTAAVQNTGHTSTFITVAGQTTIRMEVSRSGAGWTVSDVLTNNHGATSLSYEKL
jgi:hypothetical protein